MRVIAPVHPIGVKVTSVVCKRREEVIREEKAH